MGLLTSALALYAVAGMMWLALAAIVAVRKLDRFDWKYHKGDIWVVLALGAALWPILLFAKPRALVQPGQLFNFEGRAAQRARDFYQFVHNPPPCAARIIYEPDDKISFGRFVFDASELIPVLEDRLRGSESAYDDEYLMLVEWLANKDDSILEPTKVPSVIQNFHWIADEAIRQGLGAIECRVCGKAVNNSALVTQDDSGRRGWNYRTLSCPAGHSLLSFRAMHILTRDRLEIEPQTTSSRAG
jgi:hypothetical protein